MKSERLEYCRMDFGDLAFVADLMGDPLVMEFWPRDFGTEDCEEWIRNQQSRYEKHGCGYWLCSLSSTGIPIGQAGLLFDSIEGEKMYHLGYIFAYEYWGQGYATEAGSSVSSGPCELMVATEWVR
jgi:RimJ/RimL family protein N-acetyltransferase